MVGVNISHSYFHPGGAHITWVKIRQQTAQWVCIFTVIVKIDR